MGTSYNPKIVTDGLVLNLDPANVKSYPANQDPFVNNVSLMLSMDGANNSTTFTDSSQNALAVTVVGNAQVSTSQAKYGGTSGSFDGTNSYLTAPGSALFSGTGDFTVEGWFYNTDAWVISANKDIVIVEGYGGSTLPVFYYGYYNGSRYIKISNNSNGVGISFDPSTYSMAANTWYHIAACRSSGTAKLFLNGVQCASGSLTTSFGTASSAAIGVSRTLTSGFYKGYIDDLRITKAARYTASFTPPAAPLSLPGRLTDLTQGKNNQTLTGSPVYSSSNGGIMTFNGTSAYGIGARPTSLVNGGQITIALWAKWTTVGTTTSTIQVLVDNNHSWNGSTGQGFVIQDRPDLGKVLTFGVLRNANGVASTIIVGDGTWHHIACTNDGTNSVIYIDGKFNNSAVEAGGLATVQTNVSIGRWQGGTRYLNGSVSNVLFYNRALTAAEVLQNYNATKGRFV